MGITNSISTSRSSERHGRRSHFNGCSNLGFSFSTAVKRQRANLSVKEKTQIQFWVKRGRVPLFSSKHVAQVGQATAHEECAIA